MYSLITVSIVIYKNDRSILSKTIESVLLYKYQIKLFLIDNSPTDELSDINFDPKIIYIHNPSNPGFGAAHNIAIKEAIKLNSNYHLVLNPDVYFDDGVLENLVHFMNMNNNASNVMPKVYYPDGSIQYLCKLLPTPYDWIGRRFNPFKFLVEKRNFLFEMRFTNYNKIMEVPYLSGCFMFLRLKAMIEVNFFDEEIFMYCEETDLCRRFIEKGYKNYFFPNVKIIHFFEKGSHKSFKLTWIGIKSAIYYFNKWGWFFDKQRRKINNQILDIYKN